MQYNHRMPLKHDSCKVVHITRLTLSHQTNWYKQTGKELVGKMILDTLSTEYQYQLNTGLCHEKGV